MSRKKKIVKIGDNIYSENANWVFDKKVTKNFDKHIRKSIPNYLDSHKIICNLSDFFIKKNSIIYDLGCSTGSLLKKINDRAKSKDPKLFGLDIEKEMIKYAKIKIKDKNIIFKNLDISKIKLKKSDLIICCYTIQFLPPKVRQEVINKIFKSLNWGGAFLFFEKVRAPDARFQDIINGLYNEFKLDQGISASEIFNKTRSLKGVLEPFSEYGNISMLKRSGFQDICSVFKSICFQGWIAIK